MLFKFSAGSVTCTPQWQRRLFYIDTHEASCKTACPRLSASALRSREAAPVIWSPWTNIALITAGITTDDGVVSLSGVFLMTINLCCWLSYPRQARTLSARDGFLEISRWGLLYDKLYHYALLHRIVDSTLMQIILCFRSSWTQTLGQCKLYIAFDANIPHVYVLSAYVV